ncbi:uncharacterized protein LY79DRAFT_533967 [Colletotrichum navitas]|uniref:Uncharacterized protein n=1 Tax=Colletotrichum navitas TaxID=681940 RepID=A0AAD8QDC5_9PEZI|nr:uncharacterized protein LY79DRAFT_533967 [Colletotrichum navitas]KAK1600547.1 hypothetical protein LY79DRAFT_533967 [Colletotrichum navitas]
MCYLRSAKWFAGQAGYLLGSGSRLRPRTRSGDTDGEVWLGVVLSTPSRLGFSRLPVDSRETEPQGQKRSREPVMHTMPCSGVSARSKRGRGLVDGMMLR